MSFERPDHITWICMTQIDVCAALPVLSVLPGPGLAPHTTEAGEEGWRVLGVMMGVLRTNLILVVTPVAVSCCGSSASTSPAQPPHTEQSIQTDTRPVTPDFLPPPTHRENQLTRSAGESLARARPAVSRRHWESKICVMVGVVKESRVLSSLTDHCTASTLITHC